MFISRRQLLASTAWSALAGAASARRSFAQAEVSEGADDFNNWAWVRSQFDLGPSTSTFHSSLSFPTRVRCGRLSSALGAPSIPIPFSP